MRWRKDIYLSLKFLRQTEMDPRSICVFFCALSMAWVILTGLRLSFDQFLLLACSLSALYCLKFNAVTENAPEPMETRLLRKQIQEINWRIMFNKAAYLTRMQDVLERNRLKRIKHWKHTPRHDTCPESKMASVRLWKSWSGESGE